MSGYVFWCSGCKVSHSGECPPAKKSVKELWKEAVEIAGEVHVIQVGGVVYKKGYGVTVGSLWTSEVKMTGGTWHVGNPLYHYEVVSVSGNQVGIVGIRNGTNPIYPVGGRATETDDVSAWTEDGWDQFGDGDLLRFVPYTP